MNLAVPVALYLVGVALAVALLTLGALGGWAAGEAAIADGADGRVLQWVDNLSAFACWVAAITGFMLSLRAIPRHGRAAAPAPAAGGPA